ncbi:putative polyketide synthase [Zopfia rhizophila CBS 207.26]|uniref:Putative polyketide synthase n=1 Tax=Zopfia rhizophila CBS 207.26 TaxID=1314779 RepID=A0A6A6EW81_9PEZI|nr:putative polyketide synthase [Zopfia rhizophila CBS 207.26]
MGSIGAEPVRGPIAIIGLSCKFAGDARSPEELWRMLAEGRNAWSEVPSSRFNLKGFFHPDPEKLDTVCVHVRGGHFLQEDIAHFDAPFFNFSSELAAALDPQFRLQLESVYEALENAGLPMSHVAGSSTSVYASLWKNDYRDGIIRDEQNLPRSLETGTGGAFAAGRISHFFDLRGASMTVDTACSTGAVALHQAVQSLRSGEASMSIVGGSNLTLSPDTFLSPDGKSYAFDSRANGFGRGEGVATLVVKRLKDALAAGDPVRAVIRETLLNQDGKKDSITSPSQAAQAALMRDCYCRAGLDPLETQYFEAHGTGTKVGDPIEAGAIATVFQPGRPADQPLRIGSIKTNIGHTEITSGLAGIIKVVLSLEKGIIPPSVNFEKPNPELALESANLQVVTEAANWPLGPNGVRRASINSFGASGTNAHVIVESADSFLPRSEAPQPSQKYKTKVLVLSAKSEEGCKDSVSSLKTYLENKKDIANEEALLENVMYTLGQRRTLFPWVAAHRVPFSRGIDEVIKALESPQFKPIRTSRRPRIGMVFTGQGAQWHAMGRELIIAYPTFKASLEEGETYLKDLGADWSLLEELHRDAETTRVNDIAMSIPVCVALQISLVRLLRAWGVTPTAVTSHSSGEIAAAYTVGALSYKSAMAVAYYRAVLTAEKTRHGEGIKGGMIAIGAGIEDTDLYLDRLKTGRAVAACINSPSSVTVAGDISAVQEIGDMAKHDGIFARKLRVETAYHSHHMDPVAEPYREALANHYIQSADEGDALDTIAFSSAVTGGRIYSVESLAHPDHWVESLTQPVRFVDAVSDMVLGDFDPAGTSVDAIIEVGPHSALGGPIKEITGLPEFNGIQIPYYSCLLRKTNARDSIQDLVTSLLREGHSFDLGPINFPWGKWPHVRVMSDLPSYPWDHKIRHWHESRVNKAIRERSQPPNELLGSPEPWANPRTPSWRHIFRINDAPWVRDHVIDSSILYPAAGFICRAIEGMAQIVKTREGEGMQKPVKGYRLRDFDIQQALVLPDNDQGVEIETSLSPSSDKAIGSQGWMQFVVSSVTTTDAKWTQHATGMISVDYSAASETSNTTNSEAGKRTSSHSSRTLGSDDFYSSMRSSGIKYGPTFQNIKNVVQSIKSKQSESTFGIADTFILDSLPPSHIVHPTTLDSVIQAAYTTLSGAQLRQDSLKVPQAISKLWVSNDISRETGHHFTAQASLSRDDARSVQADVTVIDGKQKPSETTHPVLKMEGLVLRSIGAGTSSSERQQSKPWEKEICNKLEWAADMSLATTANLQTLKQQFCSPPDPKETQVVMDLRRVCIYFIDDALAELAESDIEQLDDHHKKYHTWLKDQLQLSKDGKLGPDSAQWMSDDPTERRRRIDEAAKASVNGEMTCQVGPHLAAMLRREVTPLEVMMEGKLLYKYYSNMLKSDRSFQHAATLLQRIVHKNPRARILEIGGGTGGETRYALKALGTAQTGGPKASLYHFTDISAAFFEAAGVEFSEWSEIMQYSMFDAEKDPSSQGFESGSYDIVIACQVLHATKSMANTMANVRKLLKPGGSLLMVETTKDQVDVQFVFGLVPGWWLSEEEERTSSPSLSVPFWDKILKGAGFTGVDLEVHDCESEELYSFSTIMSTAQPSQPQKLGPEDIVLVTSGKAPPPSDWQESLQHAIAATTSQNGPSVPVQLLESSYALAYTGKVCVFLGEMNQAHLHNLEAPELEGVKAMITSCKGLLWITHGGAVESEQPDRGLAVGLMRTMRNEYVGRKFLTLDLDPKTSTWSEKSTSAIVQVLKAEFASAHGTSAYDAPNEFEYAERDGCILVPRLQKSINENNNILPESTNYSAEEGFSIEPFHQADYPLSLQIGVPGLLDTLAFDHDVRPNIRNDSAIAENMVQIEPHAYGVNNRDVLVALDQLDERVMGVECAGIVTKVGSLAASNGYALGDRVFGLLRGPFASRVRTEWTNLMHIPVALTFEEAASIPVAFSTAFIGLCEIGRLQRGQSVLIHAAAGGVGQAAIMIAQHVGATIFATVSSPEKKDLIISKYGIPEDHIFSSRDTSFARGILSATTERGVDVVLNSLSGSLLQSSFDVVAPFGHFVEIGARDLERNSSLEMRPFARQISFSPVNLLFMMLHRPQDVHRALTEVTRMLTEKLLAPVWPITTYPIADTAQAFERLTTGKSTGKVVLRTGLQETVPVLPRRQNLRLSPNASYLLVGGVGGIGRSVATWMIEHCAKNLILLSRSAGDAQKTGGFVTEIMEETGCRIKAISCDVSNPSDLSSALQECEREGLPPVRGIIQAAMVLQDSLLEQMTIDAWKTAILPKVNGTWNLHSQFPQASDLDFFVILSSNVGTLGNASQSNYAAGGTYQDALARWRVNRGLPCVSIDLPAVKSVGYVAETAGVGNRMARLGHMVLDEGIVLKLIESAILAPFDEQIVAGINVGPGAHWNQDSSSQLGRDARFWALRYRQPQQQKEAGGGKDSGDSLPSQLAAVSSRSEAERLVTQAIAQKLADVFTIPTDDVDMTKSPGAHGVDSLVAVELRNLFRHQVAAEISSFEIMQSPSLAVLAGLAASKSEHVKSAGVS